MLEQQWLDPKRPRVLQVSSGFFYTWDNGQGRWRAHSCRAHVAERREPIDPAGNYRVTVNIFLSVGGDGFRC